MDAEQEALYSRSQMKYKQSCLLQVVVAGKQAIELLTSLRERMMPVLGYRSNSMPSEVKNVMAFEKQLWSDSGLLHKGHCVSR